MFYKREEGESYRCGINYTKTANGHGIILYLWLPFSFRVYIGYYWGIKFNYRFCMYNKKEIDKFMKKVDKTAMITTYGVKNL